MQLVGEVVEQRELAGREQLEDGGGAVDAGERVSLKTTNSPQEMCVSSALQSSARSGQGEARSKSNFRRRRRVEGILEMTADDQSE